MKISKKAYYGLRAMTRLAGETEPLSIHTLSEEEGLPEEFLEKIFQDLRKAGIVSATKGATGGYALALAPEEITAGHILTTLDGALVPFPCVGNSTAGCPMSRRCATQNVWQKLSLAIEDTLDGITLQDLIK
ncbi:MAG: Rrf2 family transcriptional regulator [Candidatus Moraniibacteriota bacterium]